MSIPESSPALSAGAASTDDQASYLDRLWSALHIDIPSAAVLGRGLPMPTLDRKWASGTMHFSVAAIDADGRLAARSAVVALQWQPRLAVAVSAVHDALVVMPQSGSPHTLDRQGYLRLPASVRHVARLKAGDRLLLAACRSRSFLLAYPPAALDAMVLAYHLGAAL
ncbi:hypothetical protein Vqi01_46490 [Micromonospora qiuiae]|uniref:SpoVT-AbrB domain-containing protein n=1 Tax=Micromonospora qiuiae TaxID=502268 RepID=A0ABQ4JIX3_9ACTN|nr:hypothetical protein [Micromonospora qiuiae]GIJ29487.1 hypothetical protein Vqi01_46490 [Micromonospora qiuiae]